MRHTINPATGETTAEEAARLGVSVRTIQRKRAKEQRQAARETTPKTTMPRQVETTRNDSDIVTTSEGTNDTQGGSPLADELEAVKVRLNDRCSEVARLEAILAGKDALISEMQKEREHLAYLQAEYKETRENIKALADQAAKYLPAPPPAEPAPAPRRKWWKWWN